jgi:hypothetical protein
MSRLRVSGTSVGFLDEIEHHQEHRGVAESSLSPLSVKVGVREHNGGIDALRAATTLLVVFHHTANTYGAIGGWYYKEIAPSNSPASLLLTLFCAANQVWFMGLFSCRRATTRRPPTAAMASSALSPASLLFCCGWSGRSVQTSPSCSSAISHPTSCCLPQAVLRRGFLIYIVHPPYPARRADRLIDSTLCF